MPHFQEDRGALVCRVEGELLRIEPWGDNSLRVRATRHGELCPSADNALLPLSATPGPTQVVIQECSASIRHGLVRCDIDAEGRLSFTRADTGQLLLREPAIPDYNLRYTRRLYRHQGGDHYAHEVYFEAQAEERFHGMGQNPHGLWDQKGCTIDLYHSNSRTVIPFVVSSRKYGFLWNHPGMGRAEFSANQTRWTSDCARQIDYWITAGDSYAQILSQYTWATGRPAKLPRWALGLWQSKLRYKNQEELLETVREYKRRNLPLDVIVIDYFHWTRMGEWKFDPQCWPDPAAMVAQCQAMGVKVAVSIWPTVNPECENFQTLRTQGMLVRSEQGLDVQWLWRDNQNDGHAIPFYFYDATNPRARAFLWEKVKAHYYDHGVRAFWLDANEPELYHIRFDNLKYDEGNGAEVSGLYPNRHVEAFVHGLAAAAEKEYVLLCRSGWAGVQRYPAILWSGDIHSNWLTLRRQVVAGLNVAMSGITWWNTDIGGFFKNPELSPEAFGELLVRWFAYGVFSPICRLHGHRDPNEIWSFGESVYAMLRRLTLLRDRLKPYIASAMAQAHETGVPIMRPLLVDFENDPAAAAVDDQYLFGPALLVAPVVDQGAVRRRVYLPAGISWRHAWDGRVFQGGAMVEVDAPLGAIPVFIRQDQAGTDALAALFKE